jgi:hypothetical protein
MHALPNAWMSLMNTPPQKPPAPGQAPDPTDAQMIAWLRLRQEMIEVHARLEYLKLMLKLGA